MSTAARYVLALESCGCPEQMPSITEASCVVATISRCSLQGRKSEGGGNGGSGREASAGRRWRGDSQPGAPGLRGLRSPGRLRGTGDGAQGKHGRPSGWGDVAGAAAADGLGARGVWRGTAGE